MTQGSAQSILQDVSSDRRRQRPTWESLQWSRPEKTKIRTAAAKDERADVRNIQKRERGEAFYMDG